MKKIFIIFLMLFSINVSALENTYFRDLLPKICSDNIESDLYMAVYDDSDLLFLNLAEEKIYTKSTIDKYYPFYDEKILSNAKLLAYKYVFLEEQSDYLYEYTIRYFFEHAYPDENFYFCKYMGAIVSNEKEYRYHELANFVDYIDSGTSLNGKVFKGNGKDEIVFVDKGLKYFELDKEYDGIDLKSGVLRVNTTKDIKVGFKMVDNGGRDLELFSVGENILSTYPRFKDDVYYFYVEIEDENISFVPEDTLEIVPILTLFVSSIGCFIARKVF